MAAVLDFIQKTRLSDIPSGVQHAAIRSLLDTLGVAVAGTQTDLTRIIRNHVARHFGGDDAHLWWDGRKVSAVGAALANGMMIDAVDAHDGQKLTKGHIGCALLPALIALMNDAKNPNWDTFFCSWIMGYEIGTRAGISLHDSACDYHTSGAWMAVAIAAVGGHMLDLDTAQIREAMGIAEYHGPRSQMMRCIDAPTMVKDGSGWGAMAGVSAVYLAQNGFTGAPALTIEDPKLASIWGDLGQHWYMNEQYIKLYPVCRWAQPALEAVASVLEGARYNANDIQHIEIRTFHEAKRLCAMATNTEQAQYSLPFSVAAFVVRGTLGIDEITASGLNAPDIQAIAHKITIVEKDEFNAVFPRLRIAEATVYCSDGRILTANPTEAQGDPENPVPDQAIFDKFQRLVVPVLGQQHHDAMRKAVMEQDLNNLLKYL